MVQAIINIDDHANRVLNIVKAKFGLRDKSEAINIMTRQYEQEILEPALRPEFIERMKRISKEKTIKVGTLEGFRKRYGLN